MDEIKLWALAGERASRVQPSSAMDSELRLEEILVKNPEMLIPDLTLVGRQTATDGGPLDLLGVDSDGRLVLFELKRGSLSRDAVAQIIDYASDIESMGVDELAKHIADQSGADGIDEIENFHEWHAGKFGEDRLDALLPLRMFLVGLGVDDRTQRMVKFLKGKGMSISLLTFQGFTQDGKTLLARLMPLEAEDKPIPNTPKKGLNASERRENLIRIAEENRLRDLFTDACEMFRSAWKDAYNEDPGVIGLRFRLPERTEAGKRAYRQYARVDTWNAPKQGKIGIVFSSRAVDSASVDAFKPLIDERLEYFSPSQDKNPLTEPWTHIAFQLTRDDWAAHKDALGALARAVYEGYQTLQNAEPSERLFRMARGGGLEVIKPALDMFRENWRNPNESRHVLGLDIKQASGSDTERAYARISPSRSAAEGATIIFYRPAVELCHDEFEPLLDEIRYETWPNNRKDNPFEHPAAEIHFPVNADEWEETHKDKLSALARAVYEAYQAAYS